MWFWSNSTQHVRLHSDAATWLSASGRKLCSDTRVKRMRAGRKVSILLCSLFGCAHSGTHTHTHTLWLYSWNFRAKKAKLDEMKQRQFMHVNHAKVDLIRTWSQSNDFEPASLVNSPLYGFNWTVVWTRFRYCFPSTIYWIFVCIFVGFCLDFARIPFIERIFTLYVVLVLVCLPRTDPVILSLLHADSVHSMDVCQT